MESNLICSINCDGEMKVIDEGLYTKLVSYFLGNCGEIKLMNYAFRGR